jgi:fructokinase
MRPAPLIVSVGEILWDFLPSGKQLGGAPANLAYHARCLGADARVVSRVGDDGLGREVLARMHELGLPDSGVATDPQHPTGVVEVALGAGGQPSYTIAAPAAWDFIEASDRTLALAARADAVAFGSLAQRSPASRAAIQALVAAARPGAVRLFDVNLRPPFTDPDVIESSLALATALKLNDDELPVLARQFGLPAPTDRQSERAAVAALAQRFGLGLAALTRGAEGCLLYRNGTFTEAPPGEPLEVADTVGAGDSFSAALLVGHLASRPAADVLRGAESLARHVCQHHGATPPIPAVLRQWFR